jgi:phospholipase/carboxylesterase
VSAEPEAAGLRFLERVTGGANADDALPLIVGIHGRGGRPEHFGRALSLLTIRARVILPYAPTPAGDGFTWLPDWTNDADLARDIRPVADRIAAMIAELAAKRPTVGKPVLTGFSQGGMLSFTIAVTHPEVIGAAFPIGGFLAPPLLPSAWPPGAPKVPVHAFHGAADELVPIEGARFTVRSLKALGLDARLTEYPGVGHRVVPEMQHDVVQAIEEALKAR